MRLLIRFLFKWLQIFVCFVVLLRIDVVAQSVAAPNIDSYNIAQDLHNKEVESAKMELRNAFTKRSIDEEQWKIETADKIFQYENVPIKDTEHKPDFLTRFLNALFEFLEGGAGTVVLWLLIISIVLLALYYFLKHNGYMIFTKNKVIHQIEIEEIDGSEVPEDWNVAIEDAIKNGKFNLAIRYAYLQLILLLSEKGKIQFSPSKTNHHYVIELSGTPNFRPFLDLTKEYEIAWFGGFNIDKERCNNYLKEVNNFKSTVSA